MKNLLKRLGVRVLILSRSRSETIRTHKLLPDFIEVLVPKSQKAAYAERIPNPVVTCPDDVKGLGMLRNWVLDNFDDETIVMVDDDIRVCICKTGYRTRNITDPLEFLQVITNIAVMAKDAGCHCFGMSQTDIRKYNPTSPFNLCTWVGCVIGVIGRKYRFRDDPFKVDIDFTLQNLLVDRIVWVDDRYYCYQARDNNRGGNAEFRSKEGFKQSVDTLLQKWGKYLKMKMHQGQIGLSIQVKRKAVINES